MWKKLIVSIFCVVVLVPYAALAQEVMVSFDGSSADIAGQPTTNTPGPWDADDSVWSTTDEVVPAIGSQAAFKAAIAQAGTAQRGIAQAHTNGHVFVGGGSKNAEGAAGHAPSPWASIIGFDTTSFDDSLALSEISVTLRNRFATDTLDVRWFVEAGGQTYVSGVVAAGVETTDTTVTLADAMAIEWFAFDKTANIEIGAALGNSVGMPALTDVDYVGIHQQLTYTSLQNWHGAYVPHFSATAISYASTVARKPNPADGATEVLRNAVLGWTPGEFAATHDVYLGTAFDDVNDAGTDSSLLVNQGQSEIAYDAGTLDFGQTYYWRVDEVNAPPNSNVVFKGDVWSFTVEPVAIPIPGEITAMASSSNSEVEDPNNTINGSGLDGNFHSTVLTDMWITAIGEPAPAWIQYDFDKAYKLHEMLVWNYNGQSFLTDAGMKDVVVEYSPDGIDWIQVDSVSEFVEATGLDDYDPNTPVAFDGIVAKSVKISANSNWSGGLADQFGLSEVRFFSVPVFAREPSPDSGATDVDVNATLSFRSGREAARHDVYLSTDEQAVIDGTVPDATVTEPSPLDLASTYFWRIDEVNDAEIPRTWQGDVWSFTTQEYLVVDDFESYNDIDPPDPESHTIFGSWSDGYATPTTNGALVGYDPAQPPSQPSYMEQMIVHDGDQSMPFSYNNTVATYSEATANVAGQDWTKHGIKALTLRFYGDPNNSVNDRMYVRINGAKVAYDGEAENLKRVGWQMWYIDLASIGVSLSNVTELAIGFEPIGAVGGQGVVYLDGIRLYSYDRQLVTSVDPGTVGLQAHYDFEGNTNDSSGNARNGTTVGNPTFVAGKTGQAISFDGLTDYVNIDGYKGILADANGVQHEFTLSAWIKTTADGEIITWGTNSGGQRMTFRVDTVLRVEHGNGSIRGTNGPDLHDDQWHHVAATIPHGARMMDVTLYVDGYDVTPDSTDQDPFVLTADTDVSIGRNAPRDDRYFIGSIDDARIHDRVLSQEEIFGLAGGTQPFDKPF